ncbi:DUF3710 domain-containing protein [Nocardioides mangrovi]|uniref:DUF3710 domain-containing protein n=1 Tax=Nocardioides mangrovi TaxID=2874580 RepID=A0ABS7UCD1_9ACTN|nr:DUF3710 domain-containing protein [Nocardioides mangrovi]MBZ5738669.1 DUF3710 domain-containing protein [Nocardioides mangrovi]
MKFRRKSTEAEPEATTPDAPEAEPATGPFDVDDPALDAEVERLDLGSLLLEPVEGIEVRLQADADETEVQAVVLAAEDGIVEIKAFAAPRNGDLWSEVMPRIAADYAQRGGTASQREGRYGTELDCRITVRTEDGRTGTQVSRVVGINGDRWMLRATFLGRPALEPDNASPWQDAVERVVVRRGSQAMPVGAELPLRLPPASQTQRV